MIAKILLVVAMALAAQTTQTSIGRETRTNSPECVDISGKCPEWQAQGKCSRRNVFWKCRSTCVCGSDSVPCEDTNSKCATWASQGKCNKRRVYKKCKSSCACVSFVGPYNNIWGDDECKHIENNSGKTLSECKELCKQKQDCTALSYNEESDFCVLRACGLPVPQPQWNYPPYHGYAIDTGTNSPECVDISGKCPEWQAQGKCSRRNVFWKCKSTCVCGSDSVPCEDTNSKCATWVSQGKCNKARVYKKCKSSCACTPTSGIPNASLTWLTSGQDHFVRFPQQMSWEAARALCQSHGLDLYQPKDLVAVAKYLDANFTVMYYWLAGRGNGTHQVWLGGGALTSADPWYGTSESKRVATDHCLFAVTHSGYPGEGSILGTWLCTWTAPDVLCG